MESEDVRSHLYEPTSSETEENVSKAYLIKDHKANAAQTLPIKRDHCRRSEWWLAAAIFSILLVVILFLRHKDCVCGCGRKLEGHKPMKSLGGELHCDAEVMKPSLKIPENVNKVRPADRKVIAAMGNSITVAARSKNFEEEHDWSLYPGNSYISGGDGSLQEQITIGKVLREFNHEILGLSYGIDYKNTGFNVAVSGMTSEDIPRQASDLITRLKQKGISLTEDWKLVSIFFGTNDLGKLRCTIDKEPVSREDYKANLVKAISLLRENLNRTIISIIPMWNSQLTIDARSLILEGKRLQCGDHYMEKRDILCGEYRKVAYEIQNERMFDDEDFTVVVQGFMDEIVDAFRNKDGVYDKSFYATDMFHLSKYGNAVVGKFLWNAMLTPVGNKTTRINLGDDSVPLRCPTKERPYIQTLNNS
ncbi:unnamed protein product [Cylicocyclus nassatus]|uniref:Uncharacterized protein n=1 Tax=Cylicocyclus nassatus TaxID=53992 RepID=A0AA36DN12_CYLNA|nr:unnamed protein product [Cylicocyclus nassatus]